MALDKSFNIGSSFTAAEQITASANLLPVPTRAVIVNTTGSYTVAFAADPTTTFALTLNAATVYDFSLSKVTVAAGVIYGLW